MAERTELVHTFRTQEMTLVFHQLGTEEEGGMG